MKWEDINLTSLDGVVGVAGVDVITRARNHLVGSEIIVAARRRIMGGIELDVFKRFQRAGRAVCLVMDALENIGMEWQ